MKIMSVVDKLGVMGPVCISKLKDLEWISVCNFGGEKTKNLSFFL